MRRITAIFFCATLGMFPALADAQPEEDATPAPDAEAPPAESAPAEDARTLFMEGQEAYESGDYETAIDRWQRAYALEPRAAFLYNLAQAYGRLGRVEEERDALGRFIDEADPSNGVLPQARARHAMLGERLARTSVHLSGAPDGGTVLIDGEDRGRTPHPDPFRVTPGRHEIIVRVPGFEDFVSVVVTRAGETTEVPVSMREAITVSTGPHTAGAGYGLLATGGGLIALGAVMGGVAVSTADGAARGTSDGDRAKSFALIADIGIIGGVAAAGTGLVLVLIDGGDDEEGTATVVLPTVSPDSVGIVAAGRF